MPRYAFRSTSRSTTIAGSGQRVQETREVSGFRGLEIHGPFLVEVEPDGSGPVRLEADDNVLPYVRTEVDGGNLVVRLSTDDGSSLTVETEQAPVIRIPVRTLERLETHGNAHVRSAGALHSPSLALEAHGSSEIELDVDAERIEQEVKGKASTMLRGRVGAHRVRASGNAEVHAFELAAGASDVRASGASRVEVQANDALEARASGKARVVHRGDASVRRSVSGEARVEHA